MSEGEEKVRLDKWLWAARFFKTRAMATEAVSGGHVHVNGARVKPSRNVKVGDRLEIRKGPQSFVVEVLGLSSRRGPAKEAEQLYHEGEESRRHREKQREQRRPTSAAPPQPGKRPDKRARRQLRRFKDG